MQRVMAMHPLIIENIKKSFGTVQALQGISLQVKKGEIFGLIGPDGAGKTTLMRIVVTLLRPDSGNIFFLGQQVNQNMAFVRRHIGYMPQRFSLYQDLTVEENLHFFGDLFGVPRPLQNKRIEKLYHFSKLGPFKKRRAGALSGGMKQKLALSCMLMHEPSVMVMDEPTYGVDPVSRAELWQILKELAAQGKSILISTAYMDEALLCQRIALIFNGRILAEDHPQALLTTIQQPLFLIRSQQPYQLYQGLRTLFSPEVCHLFGDGVHLLDQNKLGQKGIKQLLQSHHLPFTVITPIHPTVEDVFLNRIKQAEAM